LHHQLREWGDFGDELTKLDDALQSVLNSGQQGVANATQVAAAEKLLAGKPIKMADIEGLSKEVLQTTQDLDGLLQQQTGVGGATLAKAMFGFGLVPASPRSTNSAKVTDESPRSIPFKGDTRMRHCHCDIRAHHR
jgi:hypothetical protein